MALLGAASWPPPPGAIGGPWPARTPLGTGFTRVDPGTALLATVAADVAGTLAIVDDTGTILVSGTSSSVSIGATEGRTVGVSARFTPNTNSLSIALVLNGTPPGGGGGTVSGQSLFIDPRAYGAKFDNSTDDTAALQAALNAAPVAVLGLSGNDLPATIVQMPAGRSIVTATVTVPANVQLRGHGPSGTYLVRPNQAGAGGPVITQAGSTSTVQQNLVDFGVICNDALVDCVDLGNGGGASILGDGRVVCENVVTVGGRYGFTAQANNGNETRLLNCTSQRAASHGFYFRTTDLFFEHCTAGAPGGIGFYIFGGNSRLVGCKAYGCGSNGFSAGGSGRHEVTGCEAQDCADAGFIGGGNPPVIFTGCLADSCNNTGFTLGSNTQVIGCATVNRGGGSYTTGAAVYGPVGASPSSSAIVRGHISDGSMRKLGQVNGRTAASYSLGTWEIDNRVGVQAAAYAAAITPDPWNGQDVLVGTLTGAMTINNPATPNDSGALYPYGMLLRFELIQDGTGGRVITFGTAYKLAGGTAVPTTASSVTFITFVWDGTNWRESARATS